MTERHCELGDVYIAPDAKKAVHPGDIRAALSRHEQGDWGEAGMLQRIANERALKIGGWVTSVYRDRNGIEFHVQTGRRDTSVTLAK